MFIKTEKYEFLNTIKANFSKIKAELLEIIDKPIEPDNYSTWIGERPDYLTNPDDKTTAWKTFTFRIFGIDYEPNKISCPTIASLIDQFPFIVTAEFSMLAPHTHILPHKGFTAELLRSHLGLVIPEGDTAIQFENESKSWKEGEVILFNDSFLHEAWNKTSNRRVVFMFDFEPELNTEKAKEICFDILKKTNDNHLLNIAPREQWLDWLNKGYFYQP